MRPSCGRQANKLHCIEPAIIAVFAKRFLRGSPVCDEVARSHSIVMLQLEKGGVQHARLTLVDLAGSV